MDTRGVRIRSESDRIEFGLNYHTFGSDRIGFCSFLLGSDFVLILSDQIGSDLSVWKKSNNQKSVKFNEKSSQTM